MGLPRQIRKAHIQQNDHNDCGVACLKAILRFHGGDAPLEKLREISGTRVQGTTMKGLYLAGKYLGLDPGGFQWNIKRLKEQVEPCILHVVKNDNQLHFVVCYGYSSRGNTFIIGDPALSQPTRVKESDLKAIWKEGYALKLSPTKDLVSTRDKEKNQWSWIRHLLYKDENILLISALLGLFVTLLGLATPIFTQKLVDDILPVGDLYRLYGGVVLLVFLLFIRAIFNYIRGLFILRQTRDFNLRIVGFFYSHIIRLPKAFFDNRKTGDLIARLNDTRRIQSTISTLFNAILIDVLLLAVVIIAITAYQLQIGLASLLIVPIYLWAASYFNPSISSGQKSVMQAHSVNESNFIDTIQGAAEIKIGNHQTKFIQLTKTYYKNLQDQMFRLGKIGIQYGIVLEFIGLVILIVFLTYSSILVIKDELSLGSIFALLQFILLMAGAVQRITLFNIKFQEARVAFDRMYEFTSLVPELPATSPVYTVPSIKRIEVDQLTFAYPFGPPILDQISIIAEKKECVAIMGETGGGKSTFSQLLQRFYTAEKGEIRINGNLNLKEIPIREWREKIGVVSQEVKIFNGTIAENVCMSREPKDLLKLPDFLRYYGFDSYFSQLPHQYFSLVGEGGANLSGGQKQLVAIARALFREPEWLILDEPTASLDRDTETFIICLLDRLKCEKGILLLTHKLRMARNADRVYVLEKGRITSSGTHSQLLGSSNLYHLQDKMTYIWIKNG